MSINRTPPASPLPTTSNVVPEILKSKLSDTNEYSELPCASTPDVSTSATNVTERNKKRKFEGEDRDSASLPMSVFAKFSRDQERRFDDLISKMNDIIKQNGELKESVETMSSKYDEFLSRITSLESERREDKQLIRQLEDKIEAMERKSRACGIEIRNIPKENGETQESLCDLVANVGKALNVNIDSSNIRDVFRANSKVSSSPVIVEFNTVLLKSKIIDGVKTFNKSKANSEKLNTSHLKLKQPVQPIYIAETLSHKTQRLYFLARSFRKTYGYSFCWTSHGVVYLRKQVNDQQIRINSETDLDKLRNIA